MTIYDSVTEVPGIGPKYARLLNSMQIFTIEDLLLHIPYRYDDFSQIKKIKDLVFTDEACTVVGEVLRIDNIFTRNGKRLTKATIQDDTSKLDIIWFNQHYIKRSINVGEIIAVSGKLDAKQKKPQFVSPQWEIVKNGKLIHTGGFVPIYSVTEGITPKRLRQKIRLILEDNSFEVPEILPQEVLDQYNLIDRKFAFQTVHFPPSLEAVEKAKKRLAFEELFWFHFRGIKLRDEWNQQDNGHIINLDSEIYEKLINSVPFELTNDQQKAIQEILQDLSDDIPMNRLLQGDVGSGKTIVAVFALLASVMSGFNSILMAPTQVLANQHFGNLKPIFNQFGIDTTLLTGNGRHVEHNSYSRLSAGKESYSLLSNKRAATSDAKEAFKENEKNGNDVTTENEVKTSNTGSITIGTHAILYHLDEFENVGLIVIDEQHKFGVEQRTEIVEHFREVEEATLHSDITETIPNLLTMTATPIPRSLALTMYGDLELSVINEMPKERKPVKTWVINDKKRNGLYKWIDEKINNDNQQVFVVCPFIDESEHIDFKDVKAVEKVLVEIKKHFRNNNIGLLHGRLKPKEKDQVIKDFTDKKIDILVTTPVIETGVDIKNANVMIIESPERFGLASLHQLRGRVGRGRKQGYCVLISNNQKETPRLKYMETVHNGNKLAEIDMKLRGPGDIYGKSQHGYLDFRIADITDFELVKVTKDVAMDIFVKRHKYPEVLEYMKRIDKVMNN